MHRLPTIDGGRQIDWNLTTEDYLAYRSGPPPSFYARLRALCVGLEGQRVLDLGTGTGNMARQFASQGCQVTGVDIAAGQVEAARKLAQEAGLVVDLHVAAAEDTGLSGATYDIITAHQCWLYFDKPRAIAEVKRLLPAEEVKRFDGAHDDLLMRIAGDTFTILHRIDAHVLQPKGAFPGASPTRNSS